ncbi:hypothetical protein RclHR1_03180006 [Rhizophagus clarus]|uniref:Uncharacterized protein n=1 Tax=Rhizophagus clarus TaxID=94130 RepID=A0A2Z6RNU4_9GLOM|nr:hypothetical protein RclHR1_03180006 [Rhizophagus clarus]GES98363.1 hypothetical protein GLOIN_2v1798535 [Rhizophagus clarus]
MAKPQILADNYKKILIVLKDITKYEDNTPLISYPVLIGSRAAKWHTPSFREPNDWDLVATPLQATLFINKVVESNITLNYMKLIYYPGGGLKLVGECFEQSTDGKPVGFDIELASDKVDLRNMKSNVNLNNKESDEEHSEDESDEENNEDESDEDTSDENYEENNEDESDEEIIEYESDEESSDENDEENNREGSDEENDEDENDEDDPDPKDDNKNSDKIEFEKLNDAQPKMSALMILELCRNIEDKTMFPLLSNFLCIVAPLKILEALKSSHIYWPADFHKNIADLHFLRILLDYNKVSIQSFCSPQRDESVELMLKTRIKETEIIQGIPGSHINLNMSNEDFLDNEDNLFVQRRVPHDDLHELVKYDNHPIYQGLKDNQSKALIKKSLFEKLDYQTKLNCVKEEAMVIALERYLIPMISKNQENSYKLALTRICTTLTREWFRQFAIDNYPQLSNLDKDLLSIAHNVIEKFPVKQKRPEVIVYDPETQAIFESIRPHTVEISSFDNLYNFSKYYNVNFTRTGIKITSPVNHNISVTAIITTLCIANLEACSPEASWTASVVILPSKDLEILRDNDKSKNRNTSFTDPLNIHPCFDYYNNKFLKLTSKHVFVLGIFAQANGGSWGVGVDIWNPIFIKAKSADYVASLLEIPDLTGDLLYKYVLDYLKPTLMNNGDTPLKNWVNKLKGEGAIPIEPKQHLWYSAWNYELNNNRSKH